MRTHYLVHVVLILMAFVSWYIQKAFAKCLNTCKYIPNSLSESKTRSWCHYLYLYRYMLVQWFVCCSVGCSRISHNSVGMLHCLLLTHPSCHHCGWRSEQKLKPITNTQMHLQGDVCCVICIKLPVTLLHLNTLCCVFKNDTGTANHSSAQHYSIREWVRQRI